MKGIGDNYVALKARVEELERDLAAEREAREMAEARADDAEGMLSSAEAQCKALLARAEQAERERDEARGQLTTTHQQIAEVARMLDPAVCPDAWGLHAAAQKVLAARERAEADNAELLGALDTLLALPSMAPGSGGNAPGHGHSRVGVWDEDNGPRAGTPCAWCTIHWPRVLDAAKAPHPGAALLERLRALEGVREEAASELCWHENGAGDSLGAVETRIALGRAITKADALRG